MNVAHLLGYVGRDPQMRTFANGDRVAEFSLATTESWRDRASGERHERTDWHRIRCYGPPEGGLVDRVMNHVAKGARILVHGKIVSATIVNARGERIPFVYIDVRRPDGIELVSPPRARDAAKESGGESAPTESAAIGNMTAAMEDPDIPRPLNADDIFDGDTLDETIG